jgi:hypothetical protein
MADKSKAVEPTGGPTEDPGLIPGSRAVVRDFIPEDSEPTPAEVATFVSRGGQVEKRTIEGVPVRPDFVRDPGEEPIVDKTADEKQAAATAAIAAAGSLDESARDGLTKRTLDKLGVGATIDHIESLSPNDRSRYLRVEQENRARASVLKHFNALPKAEAKSEAKDEGKDKE